MARDVFERCSRLFGGGHPDTLAADYLENLSVGGAFVRTQQKLALRSSIVLDMTLPGNVQLSAPATVVHLAPDGPVILTNFTRELIEIA